MLLEVLDLIHHGRVGGVGPGLEFGDVRLNARRDLGMRLDRPVVRLDPGFELRQFRPIGLQPAPLLGLRLLAEDHQACLAHRRQLAAAQGLLVDGPDESVEFDLFSVERGLRTLLERGRRLPGFPGRPAEAPNPLEVRAPRGLDGLDLLAQRLDLRREALALSPDRRDLGVHGFDPVGHRGEVGFCLGERGITVRLALLRLDFAGCRGRFLGAGPHAPEPGALLGEIEAIGLEFAFAGIGLGRLLLALGSQGLLGAAFLLAQRLKGQRGAPQQRVARPQTRMRTALGDPGDPAAHGRDRLDELNVTLAPGGVDAQTARAQQVDQCRVDLRGVHRDDHGVHRARARAVRG